MKVETLKDLKALIQLCRKQGLTRIEVDGVRLELGDAPTSLARNAADPQDKIETDKQYSDEDVMLWSSTAHG